MDVSVSDERDRIGSALRSDLGFAAVWAVAALVVSAVPLLADSFLRTALAFPLLAFIPGYAIVAALFPRNSTLSYGERIAISFGLSFMASAFVGLVLAVTPIELTAASSGPALAAVAFGSALVASSRRNRLPAEERYRPPLSALFGGIHGALNPATMTALDRGLVLVLAVSIIAVVGATGYVALNPHAPDRYTEFYVLGEEGIADAYPQKMVAGTAQTVVVGIANHEHRTVTYSVEAYLIQEAPGGTMPGSMQQLEGFELSLDGGGVDERAYRFTPTISGVQKLVFLLFPDGVPPDEVKGDDRLNAAYRELHLWLSVRSA